MTISNQNITMTRGDSESITVSVKDRGLIDGDKIELTVRTSPTAPNRILHKVVTEFEDGKAIIRLYPEDTARKPFGVYWYDVQLTMADGSVYTIIKPHNFTLAEEVTYGT